VRFRPCIDVHEGVVKQIVGASLEDAAAPIENFTADHPAAWYAELYRADALEGGHVCALGPGNDAVIEEALRAYPGGLAVGGGVRPDNAARWLECGARAVIATSFLFESGRFQRERLAELSQTVGPERLILDLSCARDSPGGSYFAMADRWQTRTDLEVCRETLHELAASCAGFLIHGVAVEGRQSGIDVELVELLGDSTPLPTTYAGGVSSQADIDEIGRRGGGRLDFTVGSALDLFGGRGLRYRELVEWNRAHGGDGTS
jgi:phosphoribosylformimino-5-aminoimidazole carboxamide ribotide isomerase